MIGTVGGHPVTAGSAYAGGQFTTAEAAPARPLNTGGRPGPRLVLDHVQLSTFGMDATVEVRLIAGQRRAAGVATGPAVDGYILRLCAAAAASAVDELLRTTETGEQRRRCFVEHAAVVPFGNCEAATVVVLLVPRWLGRAARRFRAGLRRPAPGGGTRDAGGGQPPGGGLAGHVMALAAAIGCDTMAFDAVGPARDGIAAGRVAGRSS